jgi:hypothetical protein
MASWRVASCLNVLLDEVNELAPKRNKASDGSIGDAAHVTRASDHNPWVRDGDKGVVTARDITHDPRNGCDAGKLAEHFRRMGKAGDPRVKYVIWNRQIASFVDNWRWRAYGGPNPHTQHVHLSVQSAKSAYDSTRPWGLIPEPKREPAEKPKPAPVKEDDDMATDEKLKLGGWGINVLREPDGEITRGEGEVIRTVGIAQLNETMQVLAGTIEAMRKTQDAILAELRKQNTKTG